MDTLTDSALAYYARHGAALFPCASGSKRPIVPWKDESTADTTTWQRWKVEGHNLAIDCAKSNWIVIDVDASKVTREEAWTAYHNLCLTWGLSIPALPMTQSARGGWHIPFKRPGNLAATDLRGGGTLIKVSDIRPDTPKEKDGEVIGFKNRGYCVAPGSHLDTAARPLFYLLMPTADEPPIAPSVLIESLRLPIIEASYTGEKGASDKADVAKLVAELDMYGEFSVEPDWFRYMGAIKLALGDTPEGIEVALQMTQDDASDQAFWSRWKRLDSVDKGGNRCRIGSMIHRYKDLTGKNFTVRKSTESMFSEVAKLAAASGATLSSGGPLPMLAGRGEAHVRLFGPILATVPILPRTDQHPEFPAAIGHPLRDAINDAIPGIMTDPGAHDVAHAIINFLHPQTAEKVGPVTPMIAARMANLEAEERRALAPSEYVRDKGRIESDNMDNVQFYLNSLGVEIRWNAWLERPEVKGWQWTNWTRVDDVIIAELRMEASRTGTSFKMGKEFAADALLVLSRRNRIDPALSLLDEWQHEWDGTKRIDNWLCRACGVPDNAYYRAVSRTVLLGLVGRIRHPGIKFDLMMVLISPKQGTEKSSLAKVLALENDWFIENVRLDEEPKELVLSLAGKTVAEVTEMRSHGDVETAKAMIGTTHDEGRTAYGRFTTKRARRNILIGSTNKPEFLEDESGGRRFLPVHVVGRIDLKWVKENLGQLIGEAAAALAAEVTKHDGEKIELPPEVWDIAAEYQEAARSQTDIEVMMTDWFAETPYTAQAFITTPDLVELGTLAGWRNVHRARAAIMRKLGFHEIKPYVNGVRTNGWLRGPEILPKHVAQVTRYVVSKTQDGRPRVTIRTGGASGEEVAGM